MLARKKMTANFYWKWDFWDLKKKSKEGRKVVELELFEKLEWHEKYFENRSEIKIIW